MTNQTELRDRIGEGIEDVLSEFNIVPSELHYKENKNLPHWETIRKERLTDFILSLIKEGQREILKEYFERNSGLDYSQEEMEYMIQHEEYSDFATLDTLLKELQDNENK